MSFVTERFPTTLTIPRIGGFPSATMDNPVVTGYFTTMDMFEVEIG